MGYQNVQKLITITVFLLLFQLPSALLAGTFSVSAQVRSGMSSEMGIDVDLPNQVDSGTSYSGQIGDAKKWVAAVKRHDGNFACTNGDRIKVSFKTATKCQIAFPKQGKLAKIHFEDVGSGSMKTIVDWLGSLEAQE